MSQMQTHVTDLGQAGLDLSNMTMGLGYAKWLPLAMLAIAGAVGGCNPIPPPDGSLSAVRLTSEKPRQGSVYIVRGLFGNFSTGMDELQADLDAAGVRALVYQHTQASSLAKTLAQIYRNSSLSEPLVLVGHSLGADDVIEIAETLEQMNVRVQLLVTVDAVYADPVPGNVHRAVNYYCSNGPLDLVPAFRGIPIKRRQGATGSLENINLRAHKELTNPLTNHFTIDSNPKVRRAIVQQVLATCPPRDAGIAALRSPRPPGATPADK